MKKCPHILLALGLAVALVGCQPATEGKTSSTQGESGELTTVAATLVNLKVPNMV